MTPKEKARDLLHLFHMSIALVPLAPHQKEHAETIREYGDMGKLISDSVSHINELAKQCALMHIDEILKLDIVQPTMRYGMNYVSINGYYSQVKEEIENYKI